MFFTHIIFLIFVLSNFSKLASSQLTIDQDGYAGCYKIDPIYHEFNSYVSHLEIAKLTPFECKSNCKFLGFDLAAIENGTMCFCKTGLVINSISDSDSNCTVYSCPGDNSLACGSANNIIVYIPGQPTQMQNASIVDARSDITIFSPVTIQVTFSGTPSYLSILNAGSSSITTNVANIVYYLVNNGQKPLQLVYDTSEKFLKPPFSYELFDLNASLACPSTFVKDYGLRCSLSYSTGTNINIDVLENGVNSYSFVPYEFEIANFGPPVSQYLSYATSLPGTYLIVNSATNIAGFLKAIELYATDAGLINIDIKRLCTPGLVSSFQDPKTCLTSFDRNLFNCTLSDYFSRIKQACSNDSNIYTLLSNAVFNSTGNSFTLNLEAGYNMFTDSTFGQIYLESGSYLFITQTDGKIALAENFIETSPVYDMSINPFASLGKRFHIRWFISYKKNVEIFNKYTTPGLKNLQVTLTSKSNSSNIQTIPSINTKAIDLLKGLQMTPTSCLVNQPCTLTAFISSGTDYTLQWTIGVNPIEVILVDNSLKIQYTFVKGGKVPINLLGWNPVTYPNLTAAYTIEVIDKLIGLSLFAGDSKFSSSIVGKSAEFLFTLSNGGGYTCMINFGDKSSFEFTDLPNLNNTYISHSYPQIEATYLVAIYCNNSVNSLTYGPFNHYVQYELSNLRLLSTGTTVNTQYFIELITDSGSNPYFYSLCVDQVIDSSFIFSSNKGKSSLRNAETQSKTFIINANISNYVSTVNFYGTFEISSPIKNPSFKISPQGDLNSNIYTFLNAGTQITFNVDADSGSNIKVEIFPGDEEINTIPSIAYTAIGEWNQVKSNYISNTIYNQYSYKTPGDYLIRVRFSNAISIPIVLNRTITIISRVEGMDLGLLLNPVSFSMAFQVGSAQFIFRPGSNKAGSHASVTFWPGDLTNTSFGPFALNMNFKSNQSLTPLIYNYEKEGNYTANFLVNNILGWTAYYKISFQVISGVEGFYVDILPKFAKPGQNITINAYVIRGFNVRYEWYVNDTLKYTAYRQAQIYKSPDSYTDFVPSTPGNYEIKVKAIDYYNLVATETYLLEVHYPVSPNSFNFIVSNNNNPIIKINDGNPSSRTFDFEVRITNTMTNPQYIVDFGDGSLVGIPKQLDTLTKFSYTYSSSGIFQVNLTVFNKVSSQSKIINIELISRFIDFVCLPFYKLFPDTSTADYLYQPDSTGVYKVSFERPFRLYCSWSGMGSEPSKIIVFYNSSNTVRQLIGDEIANLTQIEQDNVMRGSITISTTYKGFILPLTLSNGYSGSIRVRIESGGGSIFAESILNIRVRSSISGLDFVPITSVISNKAIQTYQIQYVSLGEPSCVSIQYSNNFETYGSDSDTCRSYYPLFKYSGQYNLSFNKFSFNLIIPKTGNYKFYMNFTNELGSSLITYNVTVADTSINCNNPKLDIENRKNLFYEPTIYGRNDLFSLITSTQLDCALTLENKKEWLIYLINSSDGSILNQIFLTNNPTITFSELVVQPNSLPYGLYKFVYKVTMLDGIYNNLYANEVETYIRIKPAGIVVSSMPNSLGGGTLEINLGLGQTFTLNPTLYSYDIDNIVKMSSLSFSFYCQVMENGFEKGYPMRALNTKIDLYTFKFNNRNLPVNMSNAFTCFDSSNQYDMNATSPNRLTVNAGSLKYQDKRVYEILVSTTYLGEEYKQYFRISIQNVNLVPLLSLKCKFASTCVPHGDYVSINPNTQLIITGICLNGTCDNVNSIKYQYFLSKYWSFGTSGDIQEKWYPYPMNNSDITNANTQDLVIYKSLFLNNNETDIWKVILVTTTISQLNGIASGLSSLIVKVNKLPKSGYCSISPSNGKAAKTNFTISCFDWIDSDGNIVKYSYFAVFKGDDMNVGLGSSANGTLTTQLPLGSIYDSYKLSIYIQIADDDNGITYYTIPQPVVVDADTAATQSLFSSFTASSTTSSLATNLYGASSQSSIQTILTLSSVLNSMSMTDKVAVTASGSSSFTFSQPFTPAGASIAIKSPATPVSDAQFEENRNNRATIRDALITFINNISISDINSVRAQASMLATVTGQTDEITRNSASSVANQCVRISDTFKQFSAKASIEDLKQAATGISTAISNVQLGLSNSLNGRQPSLNTDLKNSVKLPAVYDTDIENYDANPNNFLNDDGSFPTKDEYNKNKNTKEQKSQVADSTSKSNYIINTISQVLVDHFPVGETFKINTPSISMTIAKVKANELNGSLSIGVNSKMKLPSLCDMLNDESTTTTVKTPLGPLYDPNSENSCAKRTVALKCHALPNAPSGKNGNNETNIGMSSSVSLSLFDSDGKPMKIVNSKKPIDIWIPRDGNFLNDTFKFVNATGIKLPDGFKFLPSAFKIKSNNASFHLHIRKISPDINIGYLVLTKFGDTPFVNSSISKYDDWKLLCPKDYYTSSLSNESYFLYYLNISKMNNFKGGLGFGIRELYSDDIIAYCNNNEKLTSPDIIINRNINTSFTYDFYVRTFTSGCYYYDTKTAKWTSYGMEILADTDLKIAHCQTNHLTDFAGGLIVTPPSINFEYVWANASFLQNPTLYSTVIVVTCLYIIFAIIANFVDKRDMNRLSIALLKDNSPLDNYFYEIMVFTGTRREAGTNSRVRMILSGNYGETEARLLADEENSRKFRRGGIDSFLMSVKRPLGNLNYLRIWHDNSGKGKMASWYLKYIIVHDLQTREKFYFLNMNWLAVEKSDGQIDRVLPCAGDKQKVEIKFLIEKQAKQNMSDGHLWFSIFARPALSSFTRLDRVTCCFVLLYISMLVNILYYGTDNSAVTGGLKLGPFLLTTQQISIGLMSNLMTFPPCFLLIQLFRRSRKRETRSRKIRDVINRKQHINPEEDDFTSIERLKSPIPNETNERSIKSRTVAKANDLLQSVKNDKIFLRVNKKLSFPWWFKILAYIISYIFMAVALIFIIFRGITFGDEKVQKWITSLMISFLTSIFLTQPLQVFLIAFFFVLVFRKYDEDKDFEDDHEDDGKCSLNDNFKYHEFKNKTNFIENFRSDDNMYLNEGELKEARERRLLEIKSYDTLREIIIYSIFLFILISFTYTSIGNSPYSYHQNLVNTFSPKNVIKVDDFWNWAKTKLAENLRATTWYNGQQPYGLSGFLNDKTSRMIGYAVLRQIRVQKDSCSVPGIIKNFTSFCNSDLNLLNEDKGLYGINWSLYNESIMEEEGMSRIYNSFIYKDSDSLQGIPYWGVFNIYNGGGFVYEMRGKLCYLKGNLSALQENNWIDRQTRAVFAEFTIYNPNINLFMVTTILFEFLPSGNILKSARFDPLNLFSEYDSYAGLRVALGIIYLAFVTYFMVGEIISMYKIGFKQYLTTFWNIIDWTIYVLAWTSLSIYIYKYYSARKVLDFFKNTSGYGYIKLQSVNEWNQILITLLAISCALTTIKFLKLFRFNRKIYSLILTLKFVFQELFWFSVIFMVIYLAFVQVQYLMLYERVDGYQSFIKSMETSLQIMLGKFSSDSLQDDGRFLPMFFFSMYNVFIVIMMLNMFISILTDGFDAVRKESKTKSNDLEMLEFFIEKFKQMIGYNKNKITDPSSINKHTEYHDYTSVLSVKVNDLIHKVIENANDNKILHDIPDEDDDSGSSDIIPKSAMSASKILIKDKNDKILSASKSKIDSIISKRKEYHKKNTVFDADGNPDLSKKHS